MIPMGPALNHCRSSETLAAAMLGYGSSSSGSAFGTLSENDVNSRVIQNLIHIQKNCQPEWITRKESPIGSQLTNLFPEIPCLEGRVTPPTADLIWVFNVQSHKICPSLFSKSNLQKDRIELSVSRMVFWWYFPPCFPGSRLVYLPPRRYVVLQASIARKEKGQKNVCRIPQSATRALFEYESNLATSKT